MKPNQTDRKTKGNERFYILTKFVARVTQQVPLV